ncbi:hypothetical protein [Tabrizicola sp.]|uniref:hypothetical protein n=1 Tax=Tabrizicola sp. TaxID=2005166 RepID=UPI0026046D61|nr:hypothetical protein [Tabrizicola sp.]MDM7933660.1 hypothetical protein [Tabrizicola sp.]
MFKDEDIPVEGIKTDEWLCGYRAKVWWQRDVILAFPGVSDRRLILQALEKTMIACGTATLYYHLEELGPHFLQIETAEADEVIYVNVRLGTPILFDPSGKYAPHGSGQMQ